MSAKHTPGPWHFFPEKEPNGRYYVRSEIGRASGGSGVGVATLVKVGGPSDMAANGRLIAAAPTMLERLKLAAARLARVDGGDSMTITSVLEAIYDATGEEFDVEAFIAAEDAEAQS